MVTQGYYYGDFIENANVSLEETNKGSEFILLEYFK